MIKAWNKIRKSGGIQAGFQTLDIRGWHDRQNNVTKNGDHDDDEEEEADDYDDECIRWEKVYVMQLRCLALSRCWLLKVMNGERNLTD